MPTILFEHPQFLLVNKPAGLSFHREGDAPGLLDLIRAQSQHTDLHAVHRLDRITSGLVLLARGSEAAARFGKLFSEHRIDKFYIALSAQPPNKKQGSITGDMQASRNGSWRLSRSQLNPARTQFCSTRLDPHHHLFLLRPLSGRTHQLRVALKSIAAPILGDERYQGGPADRGYLHAYALRFTLGGENFTFIHAPEQGELWPPAILNPVLATLTPPSAWRWPFAS